MIPSWMECVRLAELLGELAALISSVVRFRRM